MQRTRARLDRVQLLAHPVRAKRELRPSLPEDDMPANRRLAALLIFLSLWLSLVAATASAGPAMLFEAKTGKLLYAEDMDDQWHPASLTKIMTAYLTFEALKTGKFALETKIPYSEAAQLQPPSKIGLPIGAEISVDMAIQAIIIKSANDISVTLAEAIGGSEAGFVEKMNAAAKRLGMSRTHFMNANGLPAPEQVTTARDLGKLARAVVRDYPEYNHYWSLADMRIGRIRIRTHNSVLKTYEGADGLKTGFICDSGYQCRGKRHPRGRSTGRRRARRSHRTGALRPCPGPAGARLQQLGLEDTP